MINSCLDSRFGGQGSKTGVGWCVFGFKKYFCNAKCCSAAFLHLYNLARKLDPSFTRKNLFKCSCNFAKIFANFYSLSRVWYVESEKIRK